jgi:hypothetical protein
MKVLLLFFAIIFAGRAQNVFPDLITDRPDQTESSTVVPLKSLQIESGFVLENNSNDYANEKSYTINSTLFRYGIMENFELRLGLEFLKNSIELKNSDSTSAISGLGPLYTGFKLQICDEELYLPEIAFLGGLILPLTANKNFNLKYSGSAFRFSLSHTISGSTSVGYNLGVEWDGESSIPIYFYSLAIGIDISDKLGMFIESFGMLPEDGNSENLIDGGFTYLLSSSFQIDVSGGFGINDSAINNFISFGLSLRFPK